MRKGGAKFVYLFPCFLFHDIILFKEKLVTVVNTP